MRIHSIDYHNIRKDVFPTGIVDAFIESIRAHLLPEQVFDDSTLGAWAESNGYKKIQAVEDIQDKAGGVCDDPNLL